MAQSFFLFFYPRHIKPITSLVPPVGSRGETKQGLFWGGKGRIEEESEVTGLQEESHHATPFQPHTFNFKFNIRILCGR